MKPDISAGKGSPRSPECRKCNRDLCECSSDRCAGCNQHLSPYAPVTHLHTAQRLISYHQGCLEITCNLEPCGICGKLISPYDTETGINYTFFHSGCLRNPETLLPCRTCGCLITPYGKYAGGSGYCSERCRNG